MIEVVPGPRVATKRLPHAICRNPGWYRYMGECSEPSENETASTQMKVCGRRG